MTDTTIDAGPGFIIDSVFSLVESTPKTQDVQETGSPRTEVISDSYSKEMVESMISNSPIPIRKCSVKVDNFIEKELCSKITEACNNAIIKREPILDSEEKSKENSIGLSNGDTLEVSMNRPTRKRKANSLLSTEFVCKKEDLLELKLMKNQKKIKQEEVKCQIDHDLVMSVAEKCLPEVVEKSDYKEEVKMVSILPQTLQIKIKDTQVLVDWKEKIPQPSDDIYVPMRPQTARTKRKLRTQEQIDQENAEIAKKKRPKPKSRTKKKLKDPPPPHLEPYDGQDMYKTTDTPGSPGMLPPNLMPYELDAHVENLKNKIKSVKNDLISNIQSSYEATAKDDMDRNRISCSLTGRMRKPNLQYENYFSTHVQKKQKTKEKKSPQTKQTENVPEQNATINHENNTVQVTMLPNAENHSSISSKNIPNILSQAKSFIGPNVQTGQRIIKHIPPTISRTPQTHQTGNNTKLTSAIGELAKMEKTKKFFQLVVGDKVVLIPTDGNNVVPKAFVMDISATKPGSSITQVKSSAPDAVKKTIPVHQTGVGTPVSKQMPHIPSGSNIIIVQKPGTNVLTEKSQGGKTISQPMMGNKSVFSPTLIAKNTVQPKIPVAASPVSTGSYSILQQVVKMPSASSYSIINNQGQPVVVPVVSNVGKTAPYPTYMVSNVTAGKSNSIVKSVTPLNINSTVNGSSSPNVDTNNSNNLQTIVTQVKKEPDNIRDYEKAASSFKGVPDDGSDTESDTETQSAQAKRQSEKLNTIVPEVGTHVPSSESQAAERIRKLKEKLRQQQLEVENLRKNAVKHTEDIA